MPIYKVFISFVYVGDGAHNVVGRHMVGEWAYMAALWAAPPTWFMWLMREGCSAAAAAALRCGSPYMLATVSMLAPPP